MLTDTMNDSLTKIMSSELRKDAVESDPIEHTIIVEVDVPLPTVEFSDRQTLSSGKRNIRVVGGGSDAIVAETRAELEKVLGRKSDRYLPSSRSFIVEATGAEIKQLAKIPSVLAIWPNTSRKLYQL